MPSRHRATAAGAGLVCVNAVGWLVALGLFAGRPALLAAALLAWGLGLRHALDPDHLAVIGNAVRAEVDGDPPRRGFAGLAPGAWFALGHSTIVVVACALAAAASSRWRAEFEPLRRAGTAAGPVVSSTFLLGVALLNAASVVALWRRSPASGDAPPAPSPFMRLLRPLRGQIARGRAMYPIGLLMGLGFDTASEIALLALSASEAAQGLPFGAVLAFPMLFAAGMAAVDAGNGWMLSKTYRWAASDPRRRRRCNLAITAASAAVAFGIAGWQLRDVFDDTALPSAAVRADSPAR